MLIDYMTGIRREVRDPIAKVLIARKIARPAYMTRDMTAMPVTATEIHDLDAMGLDALHALAKSKGVKVHHRAGAEKVRAAILEQG